MPDATVADPGIPPRPARGLGDLAVTPHELATQAALEIMAAGGNAVDGAIAANAVLGVVLPTTCGIGGDLFALVHRPGSDGPLAINASGRAGSGADADELRRAGHRTVPTTGPWGVTAPGCVDGWELLLARAGTMPLGDVLAPAIRLAAGFPASDELSADLGRITGRIAGAASAGPLYPGGAAPAPGAPLARPYLERTLRDIAEGGRSAFYEGRVADAIGEATGGRLTPDDLRRPHADVVEPLGLEVFGATAWTVPPNSQGFLVLAAAWLMDRWSRDDDFGGRYLHAAIEAYRAAASERDALLADPDFAPLDAPDLVAPERLRRYVDGYDQGAAGRWPAPSPAPGGTAYLCAIDRDGLGVSLIQSNFTGIGSGLSAGRTGVWLHNRGAGFCLERGHPNEMAPGKRPLHTLSPTLWTTEGRLSMLLGTRGGHQQPQLLLQAAANVLRLGLAPHLAQTLPRWTMAEFGPGTASHVLVEARMPDDVVGDLARRNHDVTRIDDSWQAGWGPVSIITVGGDGARTGAADPRVSSALAAAR